MGEARELIAALRELNRTPDRSVARFASSLVGMFGSNNMFELFLFDVDAALEAGSASDTLKRRARNLVHTFIPQVAGYNGIRDLRALKVTAEKLRAIHTDSPESRREGVETILSALLQILDEVIKLG
ncbi:MAG TPA: hypothetical protein VI389_09015 [Geobacteraceae bacterium]